ncbi:hypothetical protein C8Q73DRAFT_617994, partial [Cubamyces lactineus]
MDPRLDNLRRAYGELLARVNTALRTQVGDTLRLGEVRAQVLSLGAAADQVRCSHMQVFPPAEYDVLKESLNRMAGDLSAACHQSVDPPDASPLVVIQPVATGRPGRPRIEIHPEFLEFALDMRGPARIAEVLGCHPRTVRRRALELGLATPAPPVFSHMETPSGQALRIHTTATTPVSTLTDGELDMAIASILATFPHFGRRMLVGHLRSQGHHVPDERVAAAYIRFVTHCFIDGYARFVTGIGVHTNNRADTVLSLFLDSVAKHGLPSRSQSGWRRPVVLTVDHISGGERLWYDVTRGYGFVWKAFFLELEQDWGLDPE